MQPHQDLLKSWLCHLYLHIRAPRDLCLWQQLGCWCSQLKKNTPYIPQRCQSAVDTDSCLQTCTVATTRVVTQISALAEAP